MVAGGVHRIRRDTVNEWAVRLLLECILVPELKLPKVFGITSYYICCTEN